MLLQDIIRETQHRLRRAFNHTASRNTNHLVRARGSLRLYGDIHFRTRSERKGKGSEGRRCSHCGLALSRSAGEIMPDAIFSLFFKRGCISRRRRIRSTIKKNRRYKKKCFFWKEIRAKPSHDSTAQTASGPLLSRPLWRN